MPTKESSIRPSKEQGAVKNTRQSPQSRREALQLLGVTGVSLLVGCGSDATPGTGTGGAGGSGGSTGAGGAGGAVGGASGTAGMGGGSTGGAGARPR